MQQPAFKDIDKILAEKLNVFYIIYLDNIRIYTDKINHVDLIC